MRETSRCYPWRSGRTLADLGRRSGLLDPPYDTHPAGRAGPLRTALHRLEELGVIDRQAGHFRLAFGPAARCPACDHPNLEVAPGPGLLGDGTAPDLGVEPSALAHHRCTACTAWAGLDRAGGATRRRSL